MISNALVLTVKQCPVCGKSLPASHKPKTCGKACGYQLVARAKAYSRERATAIFMSRVDRSGGDDACWLWTASASRKGYGYMRWCGKLRRAHRVAWELTNGTIPNGLHVLHNCPGGDNPRCVNPNHLWLGTNLDNAIDRERKGRGNDRRGEKNGRCKLSDSQVAEIRQRHATGGISKTKLAAEYGVSEANIRLIVTFKSRTTLHAEPEGVAS